jgi:glutamine synthetase
MSTKEMRNMAKSDAIHREERTFERPVDKSGNYLRITDYYGENVFRIADAQGIPSEIKKELAEVARSGKLIDIDHAKIVADAVTEWAMSHGATHFCHWFQPLTGATAEKHDSFLSFSKGKMIERLSASQLMQGEPDASSFPNGGSRSTFEARGYTSWDMSSPMFLMDGGNGKTLCIPTAFVSYHGEALDVKTPLLRSITRLGDAATKFCNIIGLDDVKKVQVSTGAEQEYFLVDKAFYYSRPDIVMTGRTLFGSLSAKNQQLDDHYFGAIPERVITFMQELDYELHRLGIPSKTRHNEVAPGQFEIAPIFTEANIAADNNQQIMALIKHIANKHDMVALLHEKPFAGINGSGKHINWSMGTDTGINLLEPGKAPHQNMRFLASTMVVVEAVRRHAKMLRMSIASQSNDHRLGANEAPPSIISVFLGQTLENVFTAIKDGKAFTPEDQKILEMGADQIAHLLKDNTDRNRTSPFAFTGNRFEFRAVGSTQSIGLPLSVLNAAVASVFEEANEFLAKEIHSEADIDIALNKLIKMYLDSSWQVVFNGDGYSDDWLKEAEKRGLPNLRTTADALAVLADKKETNFISEMNIYNAAELETRHNVLLERYNTLREIEFSTLIGLVNQNVFPAVVEYKQKLVNIIQGQKDIGFDAQVEMDLLKKISEIQTSLHGQMTKFNELIKTFPEDEGERSFTIANEAYPLSELIAGHCNELEEVLPTEMWSLPTYYDMLFLR